MIRSTHVLVPAALWRALVTLSQSTRVTQADYIREALTDLLALHGDRSVPLRAGWGWSYEGELVSVVFRAEAQALDGLEALARRTRVRRSEYLREALAAVVAKHGGGRAISAEVSP